MQVDNRLFRKSTSLHSTYPSMPESPFSALPLPPQVAVVDTDPAVHEHIRRLLAPLGVTTRHYASGADLMTALAEGHPRCVILDADIADIAADRILERLRREDIGIPVVLLAKEAAIDQAVLAMRAGAIDYIEKPLLDASLVSRVASLLKIEARPVSGGS